VKAWALLLLLCVSAAPAVKWSRAGEFSQVAIAGDGTISLSVRGGLLAGALSGESAVSGDVLLVHADVTNAPARGVTLALQDAATGDSIGYWQNALLVSGRQSIDAAIELSGDAKSARLFVGSDRVLSNAVLQNLSWKYSKKCAFAHRSAYGSLVDSQHVAGQTFIATKARLDAVVVRIRLLNDSNGPDLRARLYRGDRRDVALAEHVVPRQLIPSPNVHDEIELCIPLSAAVEKGEVYYIEFTCAGECPKEQAFLLYAGDDSYANGERCENGSSASNWDLYFETLESD
jgi:hypothetical protein